MKKLIISGFLISTLSASGCAQIKRATDSPANSNHEFVNDSSIDQKRARDLSDSVAKALIEDRNKDLYLRMEKGFSDAASEKDIKPMLEQMYSAYGKPLEVEYKKDDVGFKIYGDGSRKRCVNSGMPFVPPRQIKELISYSRNCAGR